MPPRSPAAAGASSGGGSSDDLECGAVPTFANLRCGRWYVPQRPRAPPVPTCYFKSTDGHYGKWAVSRTRINLHLVAAAARHGGATVVDATQHGKVFPDSLSKTIPLWAHCVNVALRPTADGDAWPDCRLADQLPPWVPPSEAAAMERAVPAGVALLADSGVALADRLDRPLRCCFAARPAVDPAASAPGGASPSHLVIPDDVKNGAAIPLLLVAASGDASVPCERRGWAYVAGAGDDEESWARGLSAAAFFANEAWLTDPSVDADTIEERVDSLLATTEAHPDGGVTAGILASSSAGDGSLANGGAVSLAQDPTTATFTVRPHDLKASPQVTFADGRVHVAFNVHASRDLDVVFGDAASALRRLVEPPSSDTGIRVWAPTPELRALAWTMALAAMASPAPDKHELQRMQRVATAATGGVPARAHLKQLNRACLASNADAETAAL